MQFTLVPVMLWTAGMMSVASAVGPSSGAAKTPKPIVPSKPEINPESVPALPTPPPPQPYDKDYLPLGGKDCMFSASNETKNRCLYAYAYYINHPPRETGIPRYSNRECGNVGNSKNVCCLEVADGELPAELCMTGAFKGSGSASCCTRSNIRCGQRTLHGTEPSPAGLTYGFCCYDGNGGTNQGPYCTQKPFLGNATQAAVGQNDPRTGCCDGLRCQKDSKGAPLCVPCGNKGKACDSDKDPGFCCFGLTCDKMSKKCG